MAKRLFTITESSSESTGQFISTPARFEWSSDAQSAPRPHWQYSLTQRTVREDYPGQISRNNPTEQVLGPMYDPFTLEGIWDDRYAGANFAWNTLVAFEALVSRGNLITIQFEELTITGLITRFQPTYRRKNYIGYSLTVSPHYRQPRTTVDAATVANPARIISDLLGAVPKFETAQTQAPQSAIKLDLVTRVNNAVANVFGKILGVKDTITTNITAPAQATVDVFANAVSSVSSVKAAAEDLIHEAGAVSADANMAYQTALDILNYEAWIRSMGAEGRALILQSHEAAAQLADVPNPRARALYEPHAGESLYDISLRFYGTGDHWRDIVSRNGLKSLQLDGTEVLIIPEVTS